MKAGPKAAVTADPLDLSWLPERGPDRVVQFIEEYVRVTKGEGARGPFVLRPWQRDIVAGLWPAEGRRPRTGLVSLPRANGKTTLAAALAVYGLLGEGVEGAQIVTVASDERQARIVLGIARRMIELCDDLADRVQVYSDRIVAPHTDSMMTSLPAEPDALQGWDPTLAIVDELHVVKREVWDAIVLAAGKRAESLTLAISTPAEDRDSVMFDLVQHGRTGEDDAFFFVEYAAPDGCDLDDPTAWTTANPALHDFMHVDALEAVLRTTREDVFRRYRLGQWVGRSDSWLPWGAWDACSCDRTLDPGERIVVGFDGSASGDSTALVGCTLDGHLTVLGHWEKPRDSAKAKGWRVPRAEVIDQVEALFATHDVIELACDPYAWRTEIEQWATRWPGRVIEWTTSSAARMAPATDRLAAAVLEQTVTHDGHPTMAAHVQNCVATRTAAGDVVRKDARNSLRLIDLAVAGILAHDRASWHASNPKEPARFRALNIV